MAGDGSEDDDDAGKTDGGGATQSSSNAEDNSEAEGITICGVSCCRCRLRWHGMNLFDLFALISPSPNAYNQTSLHVLSPLQLSGSTM